MKPLFLSIQGINSYEEKQDIDFSKLLQYGVFGIFGPTGSGKSTILDAITIALYGKAARYSGNPQKQFINANTKKAEIFFSFEVRDCIYCIHRSYKITETKKETKKETSTVRFYRILGETEDILADKNETEVTKAVVSVIGLEYDDFSRSVVLPQGRFSDFLLLPDKDRRNMLERIFKLEQYGEKLYGYIRRFVNDSKNKISGLNQTIKAFGDISREKLSEMEKEKVLTLSLIEKAIDEKQEKAVLLEKYRQLSATYSSYTETVSKLNKLFAKAGDIKSKKTKLTEAGKAEALYGTFIEIDKTNKRLLSVSDEENKIAEKVKLALKERERAKEESERLKTEKDSKMKEITIAENNLLQAERLNTELSAINEDLKKAQDNYKVKNEHLNSYKIKLNQLLETIEINEKKLAEWNIKKKELSVSANDRQLLAQAVDYEKGIIRLAGEADKQRGKQTLSQNNINKLTLKIKIITSEAEETARKLNEKSALYNDIKLKLSEINNSIKSRAAYSLSLTLEQGTPCPVCGSTKHPNPFSEIDTVTDDLDGEHDKMEKLYTKIEKEIEVIKDNIQNKNIELERVKITLENESEQFRVFSGELSTLENEQVRLTELIKRFKDEITCYRNSGCSSFTDHYIKVNENDNLREKIEKDEEALAGSLKQNSLQKETLQKKISICEQELNEILVYGRERRNVCNEKKQSIGKLTNGKEIPVLKAELQDECNKLEYSEREAINRYDNADMLAKDLSEKLAGCSAAVSELKKLNSAQKESFHERMFQNGFSHEKEVLTAYMDEKEMHKLENEILLYEQEVNLLKKRSDELAQNIDGEEQEQIPVKFGEYNKRITELTDEITALNEGNAVRADRMQRMQADLEKVEKLSEERQKEEVRGGYLGELASLCRANVFLEFVAKRQLQYVAAEASRRLKKMTNGRYAIEIDNAWFLIRDDFNSGIRRSPSSLSGGELFMTSLCLALALSSKIQMRSDAHIRFFFLDEGFGALDSALLDTVMDALETLRSEQMAVGLITHVEELKSRIGAKIIVEPARHGIEGTKIRAEI